MRRLFLQTMLLAALAPVALAHEFRPAYLQLRQTGPETYDVLWKVPARGGDLRLGIYVKLPDDCVTISPPRAASVAGAYTEHWTIKRPGGLPGGTIRITGLSGSQTDVLARIERQDGTTQLARLTPSEPSFLVEAAPSAIYISGTYLRLGIEHILTGFDHLLFVLALLLLINGWRRLLATVTAFTVAHSVTLAAATFGYLHVPQKPVESVIALSIVFVAAEIIHLRRREPALIQRRPWIVAFVFGLLHGLGFAGALSEVGLPENAIPLALLCFNIGVELGQIAFIAAVIALLAVAGRFEFPSIVNQRVTSLTATCIGALGAFWCLERIAQF